VKKGWALSQIDESDIYFLLDLLYEEAEQQEQVVPIDQIPWL
jgi:hypothetical protein